MRAAILCLLLSSSLSLASTTLHYFPHSSCNAGTSLSAYESPTPLSADSACHTTPDDTVAIYVDGIDDGCALQAYADTACQTTIGSPITSGSCFYIEEGVRVFAWKGSCSPYGNATASSVTARTGSVSVSYATSTSTGLETTVTSLVVSTVVAANTTSAVARATDVVIGGGGSTNTTAIATANATAGAPEVAQVSGADGSERMMRLVLKSLMMMGVVEGVWGLL